MEGYTMKLIISIVSKEDATHVSSALTKSGFYMTRLATTGSLLKKGNVTFLLGTDDHQVDEAMKIIEMTAKKRVEVEENIHELYDGLKVLPNTGGAIIFVVDVDRFEKV